MKNNVNDFVNVQIEMVEELCGDLTDAEKEELKNDFFKRFEKIADELNVDVSKVYVSLDSKPSVSIFVYTL